MKEIIMIPERTKISKLGLYDFCKYINSIYSISDMSILEVGSWTGCSAEIFAKVFNHVICVDPWEPTKEINTEYDMNEVEAIFDSRIKKYNNITKLKMTSEKAAKKIKSVNIVYIDGLHNYEDCKKDLDLWLPKCNLFISGHDYWPKKFDGVIKAVNEKIGVPDKIFSDTSWIKRK
jgi:hypothetical protein